MESSKEKWTKANGYYFGTIAVRAMEGFLTTLRGKEKTSSQYPTWVRYIDHTSLNVVVSDPKATVQSKIGKPNNDH